MLFRKSDELSGAARSFYENLRTWDGKRSRATDPKQGGFYASMIRQDMRIHPRTLSRYLNELCEFGLLEITGGNKYRGGYSYKVRSAKSYQGLQQSIQQQVQRVIQQVREAHETRQVQAQEVKVKLSKAKSRSATSGRKPGRPRKTAVEAEPDSTPAVGQ